MDTAGGVLGRQLCLYLGGIAGSGIDIPPMNDKSPVLEPGMRCTNCVPRTIPILVRLFKCHPITRDADIALHLNRRGLELDRLERETLILIAK